MYIQLSVHMKDKDHEQIDIRVSDQYTVKAFVTIAHQILNNSEQISDGYWIRVTSKNKVFTGNQTLKACGITTGDRIEIL